MANPKRYQHFAEIVAASALCVAQAACTTTDKTAQSPSTHATESLPGTTDTLQTDLGPLSVAPIWHGTIAFALGDTTIVVDPWSKAPAGRLPKADLVLLTDIHPDHFDPEAIAMVKKPGTIFIGPKVVQERLPETHALANGQGHSYKGIRIQATPMYNLTRGPEPGTLFHDKGRGNGYMLHFGETTVYISGDTECTPEMRGLTNIDLAFVCMNLPYTMPPSEAAECVKAFRPKIVIPFHYRDSDVSEFVSAIKGEGDIEVRVRDFYRQ